MAGRGSRICVLVLVLAWLLPGLAASQIADPDAVARAYATARTRGDPDALLALFADDAVVTDRLGHQHTNTAEIRRLLQLAGSRGQALAITERRVSGDHVSWVEQAATPDLNFAFAVEAVIEGGQIKSLAYRDYAPNALGAEPLASGILLPPSVGLALPLLLLTVAAIGLSVSMPTGRSGSRHRAVLLASLRRWQQARRPPQGAG